MVPSRFTWTTKYTYLVGQVDDAPYYMWWALSCGPGPARGGWSESSLYAISRGIALSVALELLTGSRSWVEVFIDFLIFLTSLVVTEGPMSRVEGLHWHH